MTHLYCDRVRFRALWAALIFSLFFPVSAVAAEKGPIRTTLLADMDTGLPFYLIAPSGRISLLVDAGKGPSRELLSSADHERLEKVRGYPGLTLFRVAREP